ncbi:MAG TPA: translation elongation factor Ts [Candidatus Nanopelagicales bacterium]|nr:translation elongation factor Ts [Candidatus Nanopelagicales bacterium]
MATISAADVKRLREMTSAGMMECKKALEESGGDFDKAVEALRISGAAKAAKRGAERTAGNGVVAAVDNAMIELLCETDFVAKGDDFQALAGTLAQAAFDGQIADREALLAVGLDTGKSVEETVSEMAGVIGEKIELGRVSVLPAPTTTYLHRRASDLPPQVGVLVAYDGNEEAAKGVAMQIAAMRPQYLTRDEVPADVVENERHIAETSAREEGKPDQAIPKIVEGRVGAFYKDNVLLEQPSVVDGKKSVTDVLAESGTTIRGFARFEPGQG